jgi:hypothetical protein
MQKAQFVLGFLFGISLILFVTRVVFGRILVPVLQRLRSSWNGLATQGVYLTARDSEFGYEYAWDFLGHDFIFYCPKKLNQFVP